MKRLIRPSSLGLMLAIIVCLMPAAATAAGFEYAGSWGSKGTGNGQFQDIRAIAIDAGGNVYVADYGNERIQKLTTGGAYVASWPTPGILADGIAVDRAGNVYVADYWTGTVFRFSPTGSPLGQFSTAAPSDSFSGSWPTSIAVDSAGTVYVCDSNNLTVKKFDAAGNCIGTLGTTGSGPGQFGWPSGVAVDSADNVYVVDLRNYDIQKFSRAGAYIGGNTTVAADDSDLLTPINVTVDRAGNCYVSDKYSASLHYNASVKQFNSSFVFQTRIGIYSGSGMPAGTFASVDGIAVDPAGAIYIADGSYNRVLKYASTTPASGTKPAISIRVSRKSVKVGRSITISGTVKNAIATTKTVAICRKKAGKLTLLKRVSLNSAGGYKCSRRMGAAGTWVLVATYKAGGKTYSSKAVTVSVHK